MNNFNKNWKSLGYKWQKLGNVKYLEIKSRLNWTQGQMNVRI